MELAFALPSFMAVVFGMLRTLSLYFSLLETALQLTVERINDLELKSVRGDNLDHNSIVVTRKDHVFFPTNPIGPRLSGVNASESSELNSCLTQF